MKKIAVCGTFGVGKSTICEKVKERLWANYVIKNSKYKEEFVKKWFSSKFAYIPEQYREIAKEANPDCLRGCSDMIAKYELRVEDLTDNNIKQTEEITIATYAKQLYLESLYTAQGKNILCDRTALDTVIYAQYFQLDIKTCLLSYSQCLSYNTIYLIEPSDREIENDGFRMTGKKQQLEIYNLFLEYLKGFCNVVIVKQEEMDKTVEMIVNDFSE